MRIRLNWGSEAVRAILHSDEPELTWRFDQIYPTVWPEYNRHGDTLEPLWNDLYEQFARWQFVLVNERTGQLLARGNTVPARWDGDPEQLPSGIDELAERAFAGAAAGEATNTLSAMAAEVPAEHRSKGLGTLLLKAMAALAEAEGCEHLLAPLRPSLKERYPLAPIEDYMWWKRPDGQPFDPWIRIHVKLGATLLMPAPRSMRITGTVAEWESWTGMAFPASGTYVFPQGLSTLEIDREADSGRYWEPDVWVLHRPAG